jgi:nitroimidazol reductase NimA-like FMN-containing flavoprotein (pyridoxamine 5'-phosphate oxidase superfamily)
LSYGYDELKNTLYFHCAKQGLKLDFILRNPKVCATVIEDGGYVQNECAHNYKTAVFWGEMEVVADMDEKKHGMMVLLNHLENSQEVVDEKLSKSDTYYDKMEILKLEIIQIHAKAGR